MNGSAVVKNKVNLNGLSSKNIITNGNICGNIFGWQPTNGWNNLRQFLDLGVRKLLNMLPKVICSYKIFVLNNVYRK